MPPNTTDTGSNVHENITQCEGPSNSGKMLESSNQAKGVIPMHIQSGPTTKKVCEKIVFVLKGSFSSRNEIESMIQEFGESVQRRSLNNTSHYLVGENMKSRDLKQGKKDKVKMVKLRHLIDFVEGKIGRDNFQCIDIQNEIEREKPTKSYYLQKKTRQTKRRRQRRRR